MHKGAATALLLLAAVAAVASWHPAVAARKPPQGLSGPSFQTSDSTAEIVPLRISDSDAAAVEKAAAAIAAAAAAAKKAAAANAAAAAASKDDRWWAADGRDEDEMECDPAHAKSSSVVGLKAHSNSRACARSCRAVPGCNAWLWCSDDGGCLIQGGARISKLSCIMWTADMLPQPRPALPIGAALADASADPVNHTVGFSSGQLYRRPLGMRLLTAQQRCSLRSWRGEEAGLADHLSRVSLTNKLDFARLHGLTLQVVANPQVSKMRMIASTLEHMARANTRERWLLWMGTASLVAKPAFTLPLADYAGKRRDLILRGNITKIMAGDAWGFETQILLVHNTLWARRFFRLAAKLTEQPHLVKETVELLAKLKPKYNVSEVTDRTVMTHMLRRSSHLQERIHFEEEYCVACGMRGLDLRGPTAYTVSMQGARQCNEHSLGRDEEHNKDMDKVMRFEECAFTKALEQSECVLAAQPGAALRVPYAIRMQRAPLLAGRRNKQPSLEACRASCASHPACSAWLYCWHGGGCDDGTAQNPRRYPFRGCELLQLPANTPLAHRRRPLTFSSSSMGFMRRNEHHRRSVEQPRDAGLKGKARQLAAAEDPSPAGDVVAVVTAIPPGPCSHPVADALNARSVANVQDYAHLHGHEVHLSAHNIDPTVKGNFNKLKALQKLLNDTPVASPVGWMWWLDIDTVIADPLQRLPLEKYEGYDVVLWGERPLVEAGDIQGLNTGSMLFRNSEWTRRLLAEMCTHAHRDDFDAMRAELEKEVRLVPGFLDTPLLLWALKRTPGNLDRVYFERQLGINRHFLQVAWAPPVAERPFVVHYAGCTFCAKHKLEKLGDSIFETCTSEMVKALGMSECRLGRHFSGQNASECAYDAADLSWVNIRLGV